MLFQWIKVLSYWFLPIIYSRKVLIDYLMNQKNFAFIVVQIIYWMFIPFSLCQIVITRWLRDNLRFQNLTKQHNYENTTIINNFTFPIFPLHYVCLQNLTFTGWISPKRNCAISLSETAKWTSESMSKENHFRLIKFLHEEYLF